MLIKRAISLLLGLAIFTTAFAGKVFLTEISGKQIPFDSLQGKWIFINYWASWCQPCLDEIKVLNAFYQKNNKNIALFAVNYDGVSTGKQQQLIKKYGLTYPSLSRDPADLLNLGDVPGVPATFVFNPQGQRVKTLYGSQTMKSLNKMIK